MPDTFKPGDLVRWIGEWPFPLVDAPPRENTVLAIEDDGKVRLEGRHGGEATQRWWCLPEQLVHREPPALAAPVPSQDPEKWGPWQNLPCPDDPTSIATLCPHGWVELTVEHGRSIGDPQNPPESYQDIQPLRVWGVDADVAKRVDEMISDLQDGTTNLVSRISHGQFGLLCRVFFDEGDGDVGAPSYYGLEIGWGTNGQPVFNLPPSPDLGITFPGVTVDGP